MNNRNNEWTRGKFIATITGASAAITLNPFNSWAIDDTDHKVLGILGKTIGIDTHNHMDVPFKAQDFNVTKYALAGEIKQSGLTAICMTFCVDRPQQV